MFERFTERARRVIFFARYEATIFASPEIKPEHILLAILREDRTRPRGEKDVSLLPSCAKKESTARK